MRGPGCEAASRGKRTKIWLDFRFLLINLEHGGEGERERESKNTHPSQPIGDEICM